MAEYHLAAETWFASTGEFPPDEIFEAFLDEVLAGFEQIDWEVNLSARFRDHIAEFATTVEAPDFETAAIEFLTAIRTALHAAGCGTPRWPQLRPAKRVVRELVDA